MLVCAIVFISEQNPFFADDHMTLSLMCMSEVYDSWVQTNEGFPGGASGKEPVCQCRRHRRQVQPLGQEDPLDLLF